MFRCRLLILTNYNVVCRYVHYYLYTHACTLGIISYLKCIHSTG